MRKYFLLFCLFPLGAMQEEDPPAYKNYNTIDELPSYCCYLMTKLSQQENAYGKKILHMQDHDYPQLAKMLTDAAGKFIAPSKRWQLTTKEYRDDRTYNIHRYIYLQLGSNEITDLCSLPELLSSFQSVIREIKSGWKHALFKDYAQMMGGYNNEPYWSLVVKEDTTIEKAGLQAQLINKIANGVGLTDYDFKCSSWGDFHGENGYRHVTYMWIRNDVFNEIQERLNLSVE
jgi:hypothetical protein